MATLREQAEKYTLAGLADSLQSDSSSLVHRAARAELDRRAHLLLERQAVAAENAAQQSIESGKAMVSLTERQAEAAEQTARATARYTKFTFWVVVFSALTALASVFSVLSLLFQAGR